MALYYPLCPEYFTLKDVPYRYVYYRLYTNIYEPNTLYPPTRGHYELIEKMNPHSTNALPPPSEMYPHIPATNGSPPPLNDRYTNNTFEVLHPAMGYNVMHYIDEREMAGFSNDRSYMSDCMEMSVASNIETSAGDRIHELSTYEKSSSSMSNNKEEMYAINKLNQIDDSGAHRNGVKCTSYHNVTFEVNTQAFGQIQTNVIGDKKKGWSSAHSGNNTRNARKGGNGGGGGDDTFFHSDDAIEGDGRCNGTDKLYNKNQFSHFKNYSDVVSKKKKNKVQNSNENNSDVENVAWESFGTKFHQHGTCNPCWYEWSRGCQLGVRCRFCHHSSHTPTGGKRTVLDDEMLSSAAALRVKIGGSICRMASEKRRKNNKKKLDCNRNG